MVVIFCGRIRRKNQMQKTICDRCNKEIEGTVHKKDSKELCGKCASDYDKFMDNKEERKGFL